VKLGIIGLNEGNGHPYSYSAIFNGYDPDALKTDCPFELIKEYLPREHQNRNSIASAKVTHIWTQDPEASRRVARVALIPNVASRMEDLIGKVDGVILARDDVENHLRMAEPFLKKGIPLFIDKQLTHTGENLKTLLGLCGDRNYPLMACSAVRYHPRMAEWKQSIEGHQPLSIQGISRVNWLRYAHHLFEAIAILFGTEVETVRRLGFDSKHELYLLEYANGLKVTLEFHERASLPIRFNVHFSDRGHLEVQFGEFFRSFKSMLEDFVRVVETRRPAIPFDEMTRIACVVLAGASSKENNGATVRVKEIWEQYARQ
jgi:hypothetical protein